MILGTLYVYVHIYVHTYTYIYIHIHTYIYAKVIITQDIELVRIFVFTLHFGICHVMKATCIEYMQIFEEVACVNFTVKFICTFISTLTV
jgi:hypothetical protein